MLKNYYLNKKNLSYIDNVCRKKKSKFPINFNPKNLKPNDINCDPKVDKIYEILPKESLLKSHIKKLLISIEDKMKDSSKY